MSRTEKIQRLKTRLAQAQKEIRELKKKKENPFEFSGIGGMKLKELGMVQEELINKLRSLQ